MVQAGDTIAAPVVDRYSCSIPDAERAYRNTIAEYLERSAAARTSADAERMRKDAAAIRNGTMPETYQRARFRRRGVTRATAT